MKEVIEQYGLGLLGLVAVNMSFAIILQCYRDGGVISNAVNEYFYALCGLG